METDSPEDKISRVFVNHCALNRVKKAHRWPLQYIEELFDDLAGAKMRTTLHLFSSYSQIRMADECGEKVTLVTRYGTYKFILMLFGLMNVLSAFQR